MPAVNPPYPAPTVARGASHPVGPLSPVAIFIILGIGGAVATATGEPRFLAVVPAGALGAVACFRWPAAAIGAVFALTAFQSTVSAYVGLPPTGTADLLLAGLWLGVGYAYLRHQEDRPLWLWPGLVVPGLFVALTFASVFATDSTSFALDSFRLVWWHMASLFVIALAPWSRETLERIARAFVIIALLAGLYAIFRKIAGPSAGELAINRGSLLRPEPGQVFFFGSFPTSQDLAGWCALLIPFSSCLALHFRGRWRLVATLAVCTCAYSMLAADRRSAAVGATVGLAVVMAIYVLARRPFGGRRLAIAFAATGSAIVIGLVAFSITVGQSDKTSQRFQSLTNLDDDYTYQLRLSRWEKATEIAADRPFGHGLGTVGIIGDTRTDKVPIAPLLDSSYLKIALEQGYPMLVLFVTSIVWLGGALALRALQTRDGLAASVAIGACGTLAVMLFLFYTSSFVERLSLLSGWLIVGLAAAFFTSDRESELSAQSTEPA